MVKNSSPSTMDSGARAFGEGVLDHRQTRHPSSHYSETEGSWVVRYSHTMLIPTPLPTKRKSNEQMRLEAIWNLGTPDIIYDIKVPLISYYDIIVLTYDIIVLTYDIMRMIS